MDREDRIAEYISALKGSARPGRLVVCHRTTAAEDAAMGAPARPWPKAVQGILDNMGVQGLYSHQALAGDMARSGRHVVVATPTASGKTLVYNLPVIERFLSDPDSRALYLFPLKALAQDQLQGFEALTSHWPEDARPRAAIYDGDITPWFRKKIRESPPTALLTNPEMLHLALLPYHEKWTAFLAGLSFVVVDEVHTYRGVLGSHMAQLFRRLRRICARYGAYPTFIFCSATVGNPAELAQQLTGLPVEAVTQSGAPQGKRHFLFLNPVDGDGAGPATTAIQLLQAALHRGLRSIVYTQSRKMAELISIWATQRSGAFRDRIASYRAGYLPEERRDIEARLSNGDLLAVVSTSALELGIDIGSLDLCILVGYPGTVMATLQRGGRVGRGQQESAVLLVAGEDALDQYFMRHPSDFFERPPECAVLNPDNPAILARHLECAAAEQPLSVSEDWLQESAAAMAAAKLEAEGKLLRDKEGARLFAARKSPQRDVNLRGAGGSYTIETVAEEGGKATVIGSVDEMRACKETHPGAVYLHMGRTYAVRELNPGTRTVRAVAEEVDYYTRTRGNKTTEILAVLDQGAVWGTRVFLGRLKVTETITGYEKRAARGGRLLNITPLDLPPLVFETEGLWFEIPEAARRSAEDKYLHFMGGIHAMEHAAIGILPLLVMTDRNDLGGISTPMHQQVGGPAIFIYDGAPGGVGLARQAFARSEEMFERTLQAMESCPCELGCPSCVHSPKCGSGNRPIDKAAALHILECIRDLPPPTMTEAEEGAFEMPEIPISLFAEDIATPDPRKKTSSKKYAVLDVETQRSAEEVGGWHKANKMRVSVAVLYDVERDEFLTFREDEVPAMLKSLEEFDVVVGFNILRFDYSVLSMYADRDLLELPTLDMLTEIKKVLGYRVSLDNLAQATLGVSKSADGLQALRWWKEGKVDEIAAYCQQDVAVTRDLYLHGQEHGYLLFTNKAGQVVRVKVGW